MKNRTNLSVVVGERIRQFRTKQDLSQEELAFASEIHPAYIGKVERGEKCPLSKLIDVSADTEPSESDALYRICSAMNGLSKAQMNQIAHIVEEITALMRNPS